MRIHLYLLVVFSLTATAARAQEIDFVVSSAGLSGGLSPSTVVIGQSVVSTPPVGPEPQVGFLFLSNLTDVTPPSAITDLVATSTGVAVGSVSLSWTSPGDDSLLGVAAEYDLRYATTVIDASSFAVASRAVSEPLPLPSGSRQSMTISGLAQNTNYYFAMKVQDEAPNVSLLSNVASVRTTADESVPPAVITDLVATAHPSVLGRLILTWTAPGDDGNGGTASAYEIRWSTTGIMHDLTEFLQGVPVVPPTPAASGSIQSLSIDNLETGKTYYVSIRSKDDSNNWSDIDRSTANATLPVSFDTESLQWTYEWDVANSTTGLNATAEAIVVDNDYVYVGIRSGNTNAIQKFSKHTHNYLGGLDIFSPAPSYGAFAMAFGSDSDLYALYGAASSTTTVYLAHYSLTSGALLDHRAVGVARSLAIDNDGHFYIGFSTYVRVEDVLGNTVATWTGPGVQSSGLAFTKAGNIVMGSVNTWNKFTTRGELLSTWSHPGGWAAGGFGLISDSKNRLVVNKSNGSDGGGFLVFDPNSAVVADIDEVVGNESGEWGLSGGRTPNALASDDEGTIFLANNGQGRVQEFRIEPGDVNPPAKIRDLAVPIVYTGAVYLSWTVPGGRDNNENFDFSAFRYKVKAATYPITEALFDSVDITAYQTTSAPPGETVLAPVSSLRSSVPYYFAVKGMDEAGNFSPMSVIAEATPFSNRSLLINEVAPAETAHDKIELLVAADFPVGGTRLYDNETLIKEFPDDGIWATALATGTLIVLSLNDSSADETSVSTANVIHVFSTYPGIDNGDGVLLLSRGPLDFDQRGVGDGQIIDMLAYANQDATELDTSLGSKIISAVAINQQQWNFSGPSPRQFDCVNSRGLTGPGRTLGRDSAASKNGPPFKGDWTFNPSGSIGAVNADLPRSRGLGSASIENSKGSTTTVAGSTGTWTISYVVPSAPNSNEGYMLTIDIPEGWTPPNLSSGPAHTVVSPTSVVSSTYVVRVTSEIFGIAGRIIIPLGALAAGTTIQVTYGSTATFSNGYAVASAVPGAARFIVRDDLFGTNVSSVAMSPSVTLVSGSGGGGGLGGMSLDGRALGPNPAFELGEVYCFPNPAKNRRPPTFHVEVGIADNVQFQVFDLAGEAIHQAELNGQPLVIDDGQGPQYAYEYEWHDDMPSGTYLVMVRARKSGEADIRKITKLAVIR